MSVQGVRGASERRQSSGVKVTKNRLSSQARSSQAPPGRPTCDRTGAVTSYAGEGTFVVLEAEEVKTEALWELQRPRPRRLDTDVATGRDHLGLT